MPDIENIDDLEAEAALVAAAVPTEEGTARLRKMAQRVLETDAEVAQLERQLEEAKARRTELVHEIMPSLMVEIRQDRIGMPDWGATGADLVLEPYYRANIGAEWDEERREAAFAHLDELGAGDIVKNILTFRFDRGSDALRRAFLEVVGDSAFQEMVTARVEQLAPGTNDTSVPGPVEARSVPWSTLTAFVREWTEAAGSRSSGDPQMDLEKLGAVVGSVVKIKPRKAK